MRRNLIRVAQPKHRSTVLRATYATNTRTPGQGDATDAVPDPSHNDVGPGKKHMTDKEPYDVQAEASHQAHSDKANGSTTSSAISETDKGDNNKRAHEDHPAAPGPVIGMNDERGGKGH